MSFLKINDPAKRDATVKEFLELKKNIRSNLLSEKVGEVELQKDLSKLFKPITEAQKETAKEITEELKPTKEGIENIPAAITFPVFPSIDINKGDILKFGPVATDALFNLAAKKGADKTFGIYAKDKKIYIGNKLIDIKDNNIVVEGEEYQGTPGFWELIMLEKPKEYNESDFNNYARLMLKTNAIHRNDDPNNSYPKSNRGDKWNFLLRDVWYNKEKYTGSGVVVIIPSDPNALLERLDLLLASQDAGHTGVSNELVSICDELKRQEIIDTDTYKKLNSYIKK